MSFEEKVKSWVSLDNKLKQLSDEIKILREKKNDMELALIRYAEANNLSNKEIKISDGRLKFTRVNQAQAITFKYLDECLKKCIKNDEQIKTIMNYIKDSREIKSVPDIKRYYAKS